jgi:hypothetical protein
MKSKRDFLLDMDYSHYLLTYYSGIAMGSLLSQHITYNQKEDGFTEEMEYDHQPVYPAGYISLDPPYENIAKDAVAIAKALMKELNIK